MRTYILLGLLGLFLSACGSSQNDATVRSPTRPTPLLTVKSDGPEPDQPTQSLSKGEMELRDTQFSMSAPMVRQVAVPRVRMAPPPPRHVPPSRF